MDKLNAWLGSMMEAALREAKLTAAVFVEKGLARFGRAVVIAGCAVLGIYRLVYIPATLKEALYENQLRTAKMVARYEEQYNSLEKRIAAGASLLTPLKDREGGLSKAVLATLNDQRLESNTIGAGTEQTLRESGLIVQDVSVKFNVQFKDFVAWLKRVEDARPVLYIESLKMEKLDKPIGMNQVDCSVDDFLDGSAAASRGRR